MKIDKSNVLMLGNTGTGKTYLIQNIAEMLGVPCHIHDCTKLTESGYVGDDVENVLTGLLRAADFNVERAQVGIVCLDEVDKLAKKGNNVSITRDVSGEGVQQGLLKIVEGNVVGVMPNGGRKHPAEPLIMVDTSNILFIGMGAFVGLDKMVEKRTQTNERRVGFAPTKVITPEKTEANILDQVLPTDLKHFGMLPEFLGRFPVITHTNPLGKDDLVRIISEPKNAILKQYKKLMYIDGKKLVFTDDAIEAVADAAVITDTGARGLRSILETVLNDFMFDSSDSKRRIQMIDGDYVRQSLRHVFKAQSNKIA
ncbi:MAG: ATP-dependent Clp protease ATP-binding subunit ClpX [Paludibacteraceae bacterium]|nr:ATP-dependent Clp protease ATP-binding subunit ClpX [Paludibacteraceae bacterium]